MLTPRECETLLDLAWDAIRCCITHGTQAQSKIESPALLAPSGAFVTLHRGSRLRGCIGLVEAHRPLWRTVQDMAVAAATEDTRFEPVAPAEIDLLRMDISVLTPPIPVASPAEIQVGRDGLIVRDRGHSGVLLPQVAVEWGWARDEFLTQTCLKAGLPPDAWRTGARVYRFTAEVFGR